MQATFPSRQLWFFALLVGLLLRVQLLWSVDVFPIVANTWDSTFYHEAATSLSLGEGYQFHGKPTAFFPPGFPAVLSVAYAVQENPTPKTGQAVNLVLGLWLVGVGAWVARLLFGAVAGAWCGLILLFEPTHILMPTFLMSEVLCGAALLTFLGFLIKWGQGGGAILLPLAGVFAVLGGFTRGHVFLLIPTAIFALWMARTLNARRAMLAMVVLGIMALGSVGVWSARNQSVLGHRVLVATNAGINLLLGNNPNAKGGRADPPGGVPQTGDEVRDEQIAFDRATEYIQQNPGRSLSMLPLKVGRLWAFAPALTYRGELAEKLGKGTSWAWMGLAQGVHLFLFLGLFFAFRERKKFRLGWTMALLVALVWTGGHLPFLGGARYLFPIYTLLFVVAIGSAWPRESDA